MRSESHIAALFVCAIAALSAATASANVLIPVSSVTANAPDTFPSNPPSVLVTNAQGNYNYVPPNPGTGGGGTSWHTPAVGATPVMLTFNFAQASAVREVVLWDYYGHTPQLWTVKLFSGAGATGSELLSHDFAIGSLNYTPQRWNISVPITGSVQSARLVTRSNSQWDGVGLSEVAFIAPEPTTSVILLVACAAWSASTRRRR
jgi:hypothetical protein